MNSFYFARNVLLNVSKICTIIIYIQLNIFKSLNKQNHDELEGIWYNSKHSRQYVVVVRVGITCVFLFNNIVAVDVIIRKLKKICYQHIFLKRMLMYYTTRILNL